jgi:RND family efflux transporter MFP subunit
MFSLIAISAACGGGGSTPPAGGAPAGGGAAMALPVQIDTLQPKPVEQVSEFVGTIKSRRSTTIQPQVEGLITHIHVKSGDRVKAGDDLMEIDSRPQQAALSSLQSVKAAREADVAYAQQQVKRVKSLLDAGAASQQEYDQASTQLKTAEAQQKALEEQIRQMQTELAYYVVTAPTNGMVGDVPVRQGDRVTKATMLTTIDENAGFEAYISVPVQEAPRLKQGLPVRLLDETGKVLAVEKIDFISPSVDDQTQTILVKAGLNATLGLRADQFVRAHVVWTTAPGLTVPLTSVIRINGQFFVWTAQPAPQGNGLVAHQVPVTLGQVVGNDYVVLTGLKAGDKVVVGGIQKIQVDGMPIQALPPPGARPGGPGGPGAPDQGRGR